MKKFFILLLCFVLNFLAINSILGQVEHQFGELGTASGGFKPEGNKFLFSEIFDYWDPYFYVNEEGSTFNNAIIKVDGTNLSSFDVEDLNFSVYDNETVSLTITATLSGGGTPSVSISGKSMTTGNTYSLKNDYGIDFSAFDDVTQLRLCNKINHSFVGIIT